MSLPQVLEVVVGLVVVYYILGSIVSTIVQVINESLETRGAALEKYLLQAAGAKTVDLKNLPQIKALRPIRYANWWNVFGAGTEEKKVEKIPVSTLVSGYFDVAGLSCKAEFAPDELLAILTGLPDSEAKTALLHWVGQGVTKIDDLRDRSTDYFNGILNQAQSTFKARARSFVIVMSLLLTLALGTDTISMAKDLWNDASLRAIASAQANVITSQQQQQNSTAAFENIAQTLSVPLKFSWLQGSDFPRARDLGSEASWLGLKLLGLLITAAAVSQGSSFWYDVLKRLTGQSAQPTVADSGDGS
jgi:hypothetical protein